MQARASLRQAVRNVLWTDKGEFLADRMEGSWGSGEGQGEGWMPLNIPYYSFAAG